MTTDAWQKRPLFSNTVPANIVVEPIVSCRDRGFYSLDASRLMPDHLLVQRTPGETTTVEKAMHKDRSGIGPRDRARKKPRGISRFGMQGFMIDGRGTLSEIGEANAT